MESAIKNTENIENSGFGILYSVATPIGNLEDITLRAIRILKEADLILAEDTRNTSVLLKKYDISTKVSSYHKFCENEKADSIIDLLKSGQNIALVTDAGTPLVSDPGCVIVKKAYENNIKVIPIVGACAVIGLVQSVWRNDEDFKFIGFLPRQKNQIAQIIEKNDFENLIFYESPKRILETLKIIKETKPEKKMALARELTKKFEEIKIMDINEAIAHFEKKEIKGEFALMLLKNIKTGKSAEMTNIQDKIKKLKKLNYSNKDISIIISTLFEINKNEIYKEILDGEN